METFGIGEIAQKAGIAASAIRYYEQIGLLPAARRVNKKRRYDESILQKLNSIRLGQNAGLSLEEIHNLLHSYPDSTPPSERWQTIASRKISELNALIDEMHAMKSLLEQTLQCNCATIYNCAQIETDPSTGEFNVQACK